MIQADAGGRIVLVRHGESLCNLRRVVGGPKGCAGLSELGIRQVSLLRDRLAVTAELAGASALYSSVLARAVQTAEILAPALGLSATADCALCELHPGDADGMSWEEFGRVYGEPDFATDPDREFAPNGESWSEFLSRVGRSLRALADRHPGETVVVACHGGVIDGSLSVLLGLPPRGGLSGLASAYASMTEWSVRDGSWRLLRYNDAGHLAERDATVA